LDICFSNTFSHSSGCFFITLFLLSILHSWMLRDLSQHKSLSPHPLVTRHKLFCPYL
jgi:hypothetical protein